MDKLHMRAVRAMLAIVLIAFLVECAIMLLMRTFGGVEISLGKIALDAAILGVLLAPPIYWLVLAPAEKEHQERLEAEQLASSYEHLATTDVLTGVLNRRGILDRAQEAMADASRYERPLSIAIVDIDRFKSINDRYGHAVGDQVLRRTASLVAKGLRAPDKIGRLGGDEFLAILPQTELRASHYLTERLREAIALGPVETDSEHLGATVSIGTTEWRPGEKLGRLLSRCDAALYRAKNAGRNRVVSLPNSQTLAAAR